MISFLLPQKYKGKKEKKENSSRVDRPGCIKAAIQRLYQFVSNTKGVFTCENLHQCKFETGMTL